MLEEKTQYLLTEERAGEGERWILQTKVQVSPKPIISDFSQVTFILLIPHLILWRAHIEPKPREARTRVQSKQESWRFGI